jgi:hypothetical protein
VRVPPLAVPSRSSSGFSVERPKSGRATSRSEDGLVSAPARCSPRIEPPCPITVAIEEERGTVVAYGVLADLSRKGGCVRTETLLDQGATFIFRMSFAYPPEVHTVLGKVAWARGDPDCSLEQACCGVEWLSLGYSLRCRLRQLAKVAVPSGRRDRFLFENAWVVSGAWPPPSLVTPSLHYDARWDPFDPQTGPLTVPQRLRAAVRSAPNGVTTHRAY